MSAQVQLQPLNAAVLRGSKARFNCSTTQPPSVMIWTVNGRLVITILEASGVLNSTDRFSATNFTTPGDYRWEFVISNVQRDDAGEVTCQVLGGEPRMATLFVQGEQYLKFYSDSFQLIHATWPKMFWLHRYDWEWNMTVYERKSSRLQLQIIKANNLKIYVQYKTDCLKVNFYETRMQNA